MPPHPSIALALLVLVGCCLQLVAPRSPLLPLSQRDFSSVAAVGNFTCDELTRWAGTEKHFSNMNKAAFFALLHERDCTGQGQGLPVMMLRDAVYATGSEGGLRLQRSGEQCSVSDALSVFFQSNVSINNNYSHFLHGLLRLFCALLDARWIVFDATTGKFVFAQRYTIWLDPLLKLSPARLEWFRVLAPPHAGSVRQLSAELGRGGGCASASRLLYGSGCLRLLPPEKWFGYPRCRAAEVLPAFAHFMHQRTGAEYGTAGAGDPLLVQVVAAAGPASAGGVPSLYPLSYETGAAGAAGKGLSVLIPTATERRNRVSGGLSVRPVLPIMAFAIRGEEADAAELAVTGQRRVVNLRALQSAVYAQHRVPLLIANATFERMHSGSAVVRLMAGLHVFVSVHGAGMTNMFFMRPGAVVVEILPWPLCDCASPDYFYGMGGYYHGSAVALGLRYYPFCVPREDTEWSTHSRNHVPLARVNPTGKCSWRYLHSVAGVRVDEARFLQLLRLVERDLAADGTVELTDEGGPLVSVNPHVNG